MCTQCDLSGFTAQFGVKIQKLSILWLLKYLSTWGPHNPLAGQETVFLDHLLRLSANLF